MRTILVVDDDADIVDILEALLIGYRVLKASHAEQAIAVLQAERCELLVTDLKMPGMSGLELIAWAARSQPQLPVIVLTGHGEPTETPASVAYWIKKPFRVQQLRSAVSELLGAP